MRLLIVFSCLFSAFSLSAQPLYTYLWHNSSGQLGDFANVYLNPLDSGCDFDIMRSGPDGPFNSSSFMHFSYQCNLNQSGASAKLRNGMTDFVWGNPVSTVPILGIHQTNYYVTIGKDSVKPNNQYYSIVRLDTSGAYYQIPLKIAGLRKMVVNAFVYNDTAYYVLKDMDYQNQISLVQFQGDSLVTKSSWIIDNLFTLDRDPDSIGSYIACNKVSGDSFSIIRITGNAFKSLGSFKSMSNVKGFQNSYGNFIFFFESQNNKITLIRIKNEMVTKTQFASASGIGRISDFWLVPAGDNDFVIVVKGEVTDKISLTLFFSGWGELVCSKYMKVAEVPGQGTQFIRHAARLPNGKFLFAVESYLSWSFQDHGTTYYNHQSALEVFNGGLYDYFDQFYSMGNSQIVYKNKFKILGNPVSGILRYESSENNMISIYNNVGQIVGQRKVEYGLGEWDVSEFLNGIYYLRTENGETQKIQILK